MTMLTHFGKTVVPEGRSAIVSIPGGKRSKIGYEYELPRGRVTLWVFSAPQRLQFGPSYRAQLVRGHLHRWSTFAKANSSNDEVTRIYDDRIRIHTWIIFVEYPRPQYNHAFQAMRRVDQTIFFSKFKSVRRGGIHQQ